MINVTGNPLINKTCVSTGKMLDHAVRSLHQDPDVFFSLFITCGLACSFEKKDIRYITGMSGTELSYEVLQRCGIDFERITPRHTTVLSREYHAGYAIAMTQAVTGLSFEGITEIFPVSEVISMYDDYHSRSVRELPWQMNESDRKAAIEDIKALFPEELLKAVTDSEKNEKKMTRLKQMRQINGYSQSRLAAASGIPLRTLQQYEQRQKDISKASFDYIIRLSSALNCAPEDLIE